MPNSSPTAKQPKELMEWALREMGRYIPDGTRLEHLMMPSSAHKAHTLIQACSCLGSYAVAMAANSRVNPLPQPQADAIMGLFHAIGELWSNNVRR